MLCIYSHDTYVTKKRSHLHVPHPIVPVIVIEDFQELLPQPPKLSNIKPDITPLMKQKKHQCYICINFIPFYPTPNLITPLVILSQIHFGQAKETLV